MGKVQTKTNKNKVAQRTEIRDFGDKKTIVLYTTDNLIYQTLKDKAFQEVPYEVWKDCDPRKAKKVAVDLYFPKTKINAVKSVLEQLQKLGKNAVKSKSCQRLLKSI